MISSIFKEHFPTLNLVPELKDAILKHATLHHFKKGDVILKEGGYVKVVPLLTKGLVKVMQEDESGNELLLYYIQPGESCMMSLMSCLQNEVSHATGIVKQDAEVIVLPANIITELSKKYPQWNQFIFGLYNQRYNELLEVISSVTFKKTDERILRYLRKTRDVSGTNQILVTHQELANNLGVSREVVSRLLKHFEKEGVVELKHGMIVLL